MAELAGKLLVFGVSGLVLALLVAGLYVAHLKLLKLFADKPAEQYRRQLIMLGASLFGLVLAIIVIPISSAMRGQLLGLMGILLSATIALSSTTLVGNAMAGLMLKSLRKIRAGDYIRVGDHYGRVCEMDLLHTEIQTEDRDLITLPNLYLVTNPVRVLRSSGTILSAEVSLGYEVPRQTVEALLITAAEQTGLESPFVQIMELGDFAVTYRVAGLASDLDQLIAMRRELRAQTLDALHSGGVEIVSPGFMNTRVIDAGARNVPSQPVRAVDDQQRLTPDDVVFDKAQQAESLENLKESIVEINQQIIECDERVKDLKDSKERRSIVFQKKKLQAQLARIESQESAAEARMAQEA